MSDYAREGLDLEDEDRLPWLEPAEGNDDGDGVSPLKLLAFILGGLVLLGVIVGGVYWLQNRTADGVVGEATLIAAPKGDYKVPADEADAKKFAGEGDASFAASEGVERAARIDPSRVPEAPMSGVTGAVDAARTASAKPTSRMTARVGDATGKAAVKPAVAANGAGAKAMIQLGAYGSQSSANDAWGRLSKRFAYLAPLGTSVEPVAVGGTTLYRLRAGAGSTAQASALCGKLRVAGESCLVVN